MSLAAFARPFKLRAILGIIFAGIPIMEFFSQGYKMSCAFTAMEQSGELPHWRNWKELFLFGLKSRAIQLAWLAPAIIFFLLAWLDLRAVTPETIFDFQSLQSLSNMLVTAFALLVIGAIFFPASVMNFAAEGRIKAAFSLSTFVRMFNRNYAAAWVISLLYTLLVLGILIAFFTYVLAPLLNLGGLTRTIATIISLPVELLILFLPSITIWTLFGEAWNKSMAREQVTRQ